MTKYRIDRSYGKAQTLKEADNNMEYWLQKDVKERLKAAWYLTCMCYGIDPDNSPNLDRTVFEMGKHQNK
jgi:hypothetical protein